jgi:hypothetical protein
MAKNFLTPIGLVSLPSDPATGVEGQVYFNSTIDSIKIYVNGAWQQLQGGGSSGSAFLNIQTSPATETVVADSTTDTLTLVAGDYVTLSASASNDSITIAVPSIANLQAQINDLIGQIGPSSASATASRITAYVKNGTTALAKGVPVYVTGSDGTNIIIGPSSNIAESTSSKTLGFTQTALNANQHGYIVLEGTLDGLNTDLATAGDPIWLGSASGTVIYGLANKPQAPNHLVYLGVVSRANINNGEIFVKIQNGFELKELHDVRINGVSNDDLIIYNSASSIWVNSPKQNIINTASAAAYGSASAYTDSQINALTTSDIEEGSRLYYTNTRGLTTASTALVHGNHTNITASYNSASNQIILVGTGGGGAGGDGASVIYSTEQPDTSQLSIGDIWVDSNASVGYSGSSAPYVNQLTYWLEDDNGNLLPDADNVYSVGSSAFRVKDLYLGASSLYIKSPNSNTNIAITTDLDNDIRFNGSKLITVANSQANLDLSSYATKTYSNSASANAFNSASAYSQSQLNSASVSLASLTNTKLSIQSASTTYATKAELSNVNVDLSAYLSKAEASAAYQKRIPYQSGSPTPTELGEMWINNSGQSAILNIWDGFEWKYESFVPTPTVTSILPVSSTAPGTLIDISGNNFVSGAVVQFIGTNGTPYNAVVVQRISATLLRATTPSLAQAFEPYSVKVINPTGNFGILAGALDAGSTPSWITAAGSLGTLYDIERGIKTFNVSASDADLQNLEYSLVGGALPTGMTLSASTGIISGLASPVVNDTTYSFDLRASDGTNSTTRSFSILLKAPVITTYTSVGSNTFTAPAQLTYVKVLLVGGGGGAGNSRGNGPGGNGGGGGIIYNPLVAVTAGQTYSLNVGGAGSGAGCNNQSGCSGGQTTGFGGTAGNGGGGVSEFNGNCNSGFAGTSSMVGATVIYDGGSGGCSFGAGGGGTQYSNSEFGSPTTFGGQCASQYYGGGGCHSGGGGAQGIIRVKY